MKHGIEWVVLVTDHYQESLGFYQEKLGFKLERQIDEEEFAHFELDNCKLAIYGRNQIKNLLADRYLNAAGAAIYSFPESSDVDADVAALKAKDVTFTVEPETRPWGQRTAYFTDPDGHIWELQQWIKP